MTSGSKETYGWVIGVIIFLLLFVAPCIGLFFGIRSLRKALARPVAPKRLYAGAFMVIGILVGGVAATVGRVREVGTITPLALFMGCFIGGCLGTGLGMLVFRVNLLDQKPTHIETQCPHCNAILTVKRMRSGRRQKCKCGKTFVVKPIPRLAEKS